MKHAAKYTVYTKRQINQFHTSSYYSGILSVYFFQWISGDAEEDGVVFDVGDSQEVEEVQEEGDDVGK